MKARPGALLSRPGVLSFPAMRSISCAVVIAIIAAAILPAAVSPGTSMSCCRDGAMFCCLPSADYAVKSCPGGGPAALLPGLPPALLGSTVDETGLASRPETLRSHPIVIVALAPAPPDEPPRS